ncbi:MAG TPA: RidA family protein [Ktedonobacterales bacterium]|nr:RidA family protein [Ktedonobacterales bacterium]
MFALCVWREVRSHMTRSKVSTDSAPAAIGPYCQAIVLDGMVYCSGQIGLDPATGQLVEGDVRAQTQRALQNLTAVLESAGSSLSNIVKTTVFLTDMGNFTAMNEVYATFFGDEPPARSTVAVAELPKGAQVEIEAIAARNS